MPQGANADPTEAPVIRRVDSGKQMGAAQNSPPTPYLDSCPAKGVTLPLVSKPHMAVATHPVRPERSRAREALLIAATMVPLVILIGAPALTLALIAASMWSTAALAAVVAYSTFLVWDGVLLKSHAAGGRPLQRLRNGFAMARLGAEYFPVKLVRDRGDGSVEPALGPPSGPPPASDAWANADRHGTYLFVVHPHGVLGQVIWSTFSSDAVGLDRLFPYMSFRLATLNLNFFVPLLRDYMLWQGFVSASKESLLSWLARKCPVQPWETQAGHTARGLGLVVGGAEESFLADPGRNALVLRKRRGFVKYALKSGAHLVPVYCFRQNYLYRQIRSPLLRRLQQALKRLLSFAPLLFYGRFGPIPYAEPATTVIGAPIRVPRIPHPTEAEINLVHAQYVSALQRLFDTYKDVYDPGRTEDLVLVS